MFNIYGIYGIWLLDMIALIKHIAIPMKKDIIRDR